MAGKTSVYHSRCGLDWDARRRPSWHTLVRRRTRSICTLIRQACDDGESPASVGTAVSATYGHHARCATTTNIDQQQCYVGPSSVTTLYPSLLICTVYSSPFLPKVMPMVHSSQPSSPASATHSPRESASLLRHVYRQDSPQPQSNVLFDIQLEDTTTASSPVARAYANSSRPSTPHSRSGSDTHRPLKSAEHPSHNSHQNWRPATPSTIPSPSQLHHHPPSAHRFHSHSHQSSLDFRISTLNRVKPWLPFILWLCTTIAFFLGITVFRTELFQGLDDLSHYLRTEGAYGYSILFFCIFLTTFPPLPLYSTLIVLSGYTFGPWHGFLLSYAAALTGAVVVYLLSRRYLYSYLEDVLNGTGWIKRVVRAIERRPHLLFLIRVAPYPYNLMNAMLAVSPTLSFRTYFLCTALSLFKLIIHTSAGSTIKQFAEYHSSSSDQESEDKQSSLTRTWSIIGISLCVVIFLYLSYLARRAVQEETEDEEARLPSAMAEVTFPRRNSRT